MSKVVRITESGLVHLINKLVREQQTNRCPNGSNMEIKKSISKAGWKGDWRIGEDPISMISFGDYNVYATWDGIGCSVIIGVDSWVMDSKEVQMDKKNKWLFIQNLAKSMGGRLKSGTSIVFSLNDPSKIIVFTKELIRQFPQKFKV